MLVYGVFCPNSGGCRYDCNDYQQDGGTKTQCTSDDKWPAKMCSLKVTDASDGGNPTGGGSFVAGKIGEHRSFTFFCASFANILFYKDTFQLHDTIALAGL